jgi:flavin-binding protein dodecin
MATTMIDAIRTVEAMAEISCLRGGFACFDNDLGAQGWDKTQDNLGTIWALVPDRPEEAERSLRDAIDECRDDLLHMLDWASSREASASVDQGARDRYNAELGALMAVA